ncbi:MAG: hypothetical protein GX330_02595 [Bacteroidales bacterium]|nr:hypothetical protein [Bacteroidales bacterium]
MNIEDIKLKIREIHEKILIQEKRIIDEKKSISALDLDTQLMNIKILYDQYLSLQQYYLQNDAFWVATDEMDSVEAEEIESEEEKLPANQLSIESLFDLEAEVATPEKQPLEPVTPTAPEAKEEPVEEKTLVLESEKTEIQEPKEEEKVEKIEEIEETVKKEEPLTAEESTETPPIEIDIDNIEFVEEEFGYEEEADDYENKQEEYQEPFSPQINPMIDDKEPEIAMPTTKSTISDLYNSKKDINEQYSKSSNNMVANKFQKTQVNDLMKAIDINNKFLFIRELFNGNGSVFTETINQLNQYPRLTEAMDYFEKIKLEYRWKDHSEAYKKLYELILTKYS